MTAASIQSLDWGGLSFRKWTRRMIPNATRGKNTCTRTVMPNTRTSGMDQLNGSRIRATRHVNVETPAGKFYHSAKRQAINVARRDGRSLSRLIHSPAVGVAMSRQIIYQGRKIKVAIDTALLADGATIQRDVVLHPGAVAILPLLDAGRLCLVRNQRPIVGETLWEVPAGTLEPGEAPEAAAVRELAEETGYQAEHWRKLAEFIPSRGVLSERTHLFLAQKLTPGLQRLEKDEDLQPQIVAWPEALSWALDGTIHDAKTLIAILLWDRLRAPDYTQMTNA